MILHAYTSPGGWPIDPLIAAVHPIGMIIINIRGRK
jgi:hypothetical protein